MEARPVPYPFGDAVALRLHPRFAELRKSEAPVRVTMPYGGDAWLTRYEQTRFVLSDSRLELLQPRIQEIVDTLLARRHAEQLADHQHGQLERRMVRECTETLVASGGTVTPADVTEARGRLARWTS